MIILNYFDYRDILVSISLVLWFCFEKGNNKKEWSVNLDLI
jgi:hypothetical protein